MKLAFVFTIFLVVLGAVFTSAARRDCICTADYTPVCGKDGKTYSNRCMLSCAGAQFARAGECGKTS